MTVIRLEPLSAAEDDRVARLRLAGRLSVGFMLDVIAVMRAEGHVLDTLLMGAVIQANVQEISRRNELFVAYAQSDEVPPDDMRRPISVNALATSLGLPFETVRRRVAALAAGGWCRVTDEGIVVPASVLSAPKYQADAFLTFQRLQAFYYEMRDLDVLGELPAPSVEMAGVFPVRAVARLVGSYLLRAVEALGRMADLLEALILLEMFRANVEHLPPGLPGDSPAGPGHVVTDALRRPISIAGLAKRLGMPPETIRRRVANLMARDMCIRVDGGLIVPARALARPHLWSALASNAANLQRLFVTLSQLGVLKIWDDMRPRP